MAGEGLGVRLQPRRGGEDVLRLAEELRHRQVVAVHGDLQRRQALLQLEKYFALSTK